MPSPVRNCLAGLVLALSLASLASAQPAPASNSLGAPTPGAASAPLAPEAYMQRLLDYRASMLDARLAGLKAGLRLTADQEKLWAPFEAAVRNFADMRTARVQKMVERAMRMESGGEGPEMGLSPLDRLDMMASRMIDVGQGLKKVADTAKPLYASLDDEQKRMFGFLSREMMMMGRGRHGDGMGPPHRYDEEDDDGFGDE